VFGHAVLRHEPEHGLQAAAQVVVVADHRPEDFVNFRRLESVSSRNGSRGR
jgi:hypothetical protein